ncbi:MAG: MmgE/PrpD family protein [Chloroflexota bacterium]|nr:MmgE/PrpD family protein [Chloroflexota bacterium]
MGITSRLASFVVDTSFSDIPGNVIQMSKQMMLNSAAAGLGASADTAVDTIIQLVEEMGGKPECTIMGRSIRSSPLYAALSNGVMMDLPDYEGAVRRRVCASSRVVSPAVMALGERMAMPGREVLVAFTLGCEVSTKVGAAGDLDELIRPRMVNYGWHLAAVAGVIGAAAAAGKLLGLGQHEMESTLGVAVSQASGLQMNTGNAVTPFENGKAAMNGIMAAILAQKGLTGAQNALEAKYGFFDCYRRDNNVDEDQFFRSLANPYDVIDPGMLLKLYPCGSHTATAVEATLQLVEQHKINPEQVRSVRATVVEPHSGTLLRTPEAGLEGKKSIKYCMAVSLVHGRPQLHHFTDEAVHDPEVRAVMDRITWEATEQATKEVPSPSTVTITLTDGREVSHRAKYEKGHPGNPLTPQELDSKFSECSLNKLSPDQIKETIDRFHHLDELPNVAPLIALLGTMEK